MSLELKQIFMPNTNTENLYVNYENKLKPRISFLDSSLKNIYKKHEDQIVEDIVREATEYLNDDDTCNDEIDMFPRRCELTSEWYIGDIVFEDLSFLSVMAHFLGLLPNSRTGVDDYLGLEFTFYFDENQNKFILNGLNSSCI